MQGVKRSGKAITRLSTKGDRALPFLSDTRLGLFEATRIRHSERPREANSLTQKYSHLGYMYICMHVCMSLYVYVCTYVRIDESGVSIVRSTGKYR